MINGLMEQEGKTSSVRVAMFICVMTGCAVAVLGVLRDRNLIDTAFLCLALLGPGFTAKVTQKKVEAKNATSSLVVDSGAA